MMKKFSFADIVYFVVNSCILIIALKIYSTFSVLELSILLIILGMMSLAYLYNNQTATKISCFLINILIIIYLTTQTVFYRAFFSYYGMKYALSMLGTLAHFTDSAREFVGKRDFVMPLITIITLIVFLIIKDRREIFIKKKYILVVGLSLIILGISLYTFNVGHMKKMDNAVNTNLSDYYIYNTVPNEELFIERYGFLTFLVRDVEKTFEVLSFDDKKEEIDNCLSMRGEREENEFTGIFKDKSVLIIQAESLSDIAINKEITPILWKLKNEGIFVNGFNTPLLHGSTSDSEFMANVSLIPDGNVGSSNNEYPYNTYKVTLPKMFAYEGYIPVAFHNLWKTMYNREILFSELGFSYYFDNNLVPDTVEVDDILHHMSNSDQKMMMFWISYSGHGPYNIEEAVNYDKDEFNYIKEKYPGLKDDNAIYLAKNMDFDHSLEKILNLLEEENSLSDWVIVIYGDHYAKGLDYSEEGNLVSTLGNNGISKNTDLIIYNSETEPMVINKVGTTLDIIPTLANMFDLKYQYQKILGHDLFDKRYHGFYFSNSGEWETDDFYYDIKTNEIRLKENSKVTIEEAEEELNNLRKLPDISTSILKLDYFKEND